MHVNSRRNMTDVQGLHKNVGFIGGGNMAQAIGLRLIKKSILKASKIWVSSKTQKTLNIWKNVGANTTLFNYEVVNNCDIIFLAVKPHILDEALSTSKPSTVSNGRKLFISVIVGISLDVLHAKLISIDLKPKIIRTMPNTSVMVSEGITVYCCNNTTKDDENNVDMLFSQLGVCEKISESLMNSVGGLSGSGPAYVYVVMEALADGAVKKGIPRDLALKFAAQVFIGAGKMVLETGKHPGQLKDEVCSPNGSTITGIHEMERGSVRASMINAVEAAVNRSHELTILMAKSKILNNKT